jgi:hypothetical protein
LRERLADGITENTARDELTRLLGHNRRSVTFRYCPQLDT